MIPRASITAWRHSAPWGDDAQVEQDLLLTRALVAIFSHPRLADGLVFRGGTALHKLYLTPPGRYSEDIDLVQRTAGPIGPLIDALRGVLVPWLGEPKRRAGEGRFTLYHRFETTGLPIIAMRLKVEINTRGHFCIHGYTHRVIAADTPWFSGRVEVPTYTLPELLGTKLRALYQRKKGRDLFDLALALHHPDFDAVRVVEAFQHYMAAGGTPVTRALFEANMASKLRDPLFSADVPRCCERASPSIPTTPGNKSRSL